MTNTKAPSARPATPATLAQPDAVVNGIDTAALRGTAAAVSADPAQGVVGFDVKTTWKGGTRSDSQVAGWKLAGEHKPKDFTIRADEPQELLGGNTAPNPQELLLAALNACMVVGYVAGAAAEGIRLESLSIESSGQLDMRGFLGLDPSVKPGYESLHYTVRLKGNGTPEQFKKLHESVAAQSPNRSNIAQPIRLTSDLVIG